MTALDGVLADLVEADGDCSYVTVRRVLVEALIEEWIERGDRLGLIVSVVAQLRAVLESNDFHCDAAATIPSPTRSECILSALDFATSASASVLAHHRHAIRRQLAAKVKRTLHRAVEDVGKHLNDAILAGDTELAERLESERQTVRIVMRTIDAVVDRSLEDELRKAADSGERTALPQG
jgi:DNA-binding GntR family transcriptional regulator